MRRLIFALAVLVGSPTVAHAVSIVPIQDGRLVEVALPPPEGGLFLPSAPFADFDVFTGGVGITAGFQTSTIRSNALNGDGSTQQDGGGGEFARSVFDVTFQVDAPAAYGLDFDLYVDQLGVAAVELSGPAGILFAQSTTGLAGMLAGMNSGVLQPGVNYRLIVSGMHPTSNTSEFTSFDFRLDVSDLPEPGVVSLLLAALLLPRKGRRLGRPTIDPGRRD